MIDLDHNATTRPAEEVIETIAFHMSKNYANPGSRHGLGRNARKVLESSREQIADLLGAKPEEITFTSGGTEANNLALLGLPFSSDKTLLNLPGDHPSSLDSCNELAKKGWKLSSLELDSDGLIQPSQLQKINWEQVGLVDFLYAHNETGVIQDLDEIGDICATHGIPFHLDAVQAVGKIPIHFGQTKATSLSLAAHKFHGPRGIGALIISKSLKLNPILFGGHQESGMRPGTEMAPLAAGMAKALELCAHDMENRTEKMESLRNQLETQLSELCSPVVIHGKNVPRLPNTLNIAFPGIDGEAFLVAADLEGIACSQGSTCASGSAQPTPVLTAMGHPDEIVLSSIRFSVGIDNTMGEINEAAQIISKVVESLRKQA
jgi:cysteine desulfurase